LFSPGTPVSSTNKTDHHDETNAESGAKHHKPNQTNFKMFVFAAMYAFCNVLHWNFEWSISPLFHLY
jgi:hypothetical protein